jgi:hypothetical protein
MVDHAPLSSIVDRLAHRFVTSAGEAAALDHVADIVEAAARSLARAPLQQFVPILVERAAGNTLHDEGMHRVPA